MNGAQLQLFVVQHSRNGFVAFRKVDGSLDETNDARDTGPAEEQHGDTATDVTKVELIHA